ncbi:hypothetical protein D3C75_530460 [compost metagenome]
MRKGVFPYVSISERIYTLFLYSSESTIQSIVTDYHYSQAGINREVVDLVGTLYLDIPITYTIAQGKVPEFRMRPDCNTKIPIPREINDILGRLPSWVNFSVPDHVTVGLPCIETRQSEISITASIYMPIDLKKDPIYREKLNDCLNSAKDSAITTLLAGIALGSTTLGVSVAVAIAQAIAEFEKVF